MPEMQHPALKLSVTPILDLSSIPTNTPESGQQAGGESRFSFHSQLQILQQAESEFPRERESLGPLTFC